MFHVSFKNASSALQKPWQLMTLTKTKRHNKEKLDVDSIPHFPFGAKTA